MADSRANALCTLRILQEHSDPEHILPLSKIIDYFKTEYERDVDRRTIYSAISTLQDFGYDISTYEENNQGYCLNENVFTQEEISLLIDSVYNCEYVSSKQTEKLLEKLRSFLSEHVRKNYNYSRLVKTNYKTPNAQVFYNIAALTQAINQKRKIAFTYMDYDFDKKLKPRRDEKDVGSPYAMTCDSGRYYVLATTMRHQNITYYRVDMMKDIEVLDEPVDKSKRDVGLDGSKKVVFAFAGKPAAIRLHCQKAALRYVIERFGSDVNIHDNKDGTFEAHFSAATEGVKLWALQNMATVEVVSPPELRQKITDIIKGSAYLKEE